MGVKGLQSYMESYGTIPHPDPFVYPVQLSQLVTKFRNTLIVDGNGLSAEFYGGIEPHCQGQHREHFEVLMDFVEFFKDIGIKLIVVFDAGFVEGKKETWIQRR